jgi:hypothetical protein
MQHVASPFFGQSSNQPLVWQAFLKGHSTYYGEKGCCEDWYQQIYLYSWTEVHGRFSSRTPAWNPRMGFDGEYPGGGHPDGSCYIETPEQWSTYNEGREPTLSGSHGMLAVNTAEFTYSKLIRKFIKSPADGAGGCAIVLMSMGWFDDLLKCPDEPRMPRLRPFFHQPTNFEYDTCP